MKKTFTRINTISYKKKITLGKSMYFTIKMSESFLHREVYFLRLLFFNKQLLTFSCSPLFFYKEREWGENEGSDRGSVLFVSLVKGRFICLRQSITFLFKLSVRVFE